MKKYLYSLPILAALFGLTSCDSDQPEPVQQWYPVITLEGETTYNVAIGDTWTEPGYSAVNTTNGEDATADVEVLIFDVISNVYVDEIDFDSPGWYTIYYNSYGSMLETIPTVYKTRTILVFDPTVTVDISGTWMVNLNESRRIRYAGTNAGQDLTFQEVADANDNDVSAGIPVEFELLVPGFYYVDDIEAGLVAFLYGYSSTYASYPLWYWQYEAYVTLSSDNELNYLTGGLGYSPWEDTFHVGGFEGEYDPDANTIHYIVDVTPQGFILDVVLEREDD
ncbi:MAG: hypothetical protein J1F38_10360 [Muribaculaceae bacterium]|nr:hypothetical protein [Muribaculaceae bacterium]